MRYSQPFAYYTVHSQDVLVFLNSWKKWREFPTTSVKYIRVIACAHKPGFIGKQSFGQANYRVPSVCRFKT